MDRNEEIYTAECGFVMSFGKKDNTRVKTQRQTITLDNELERILT